MSKLTEQNVKDIVTMYESGRSIRAIAETFGVRYFAIHQRLTKQGVALRPRGGPRKVTEDVATVSPAD